MLAEAVALPEIKWNGRIWVILISDYQYLEPKALVAHGASWDCKLFCDQNRVPDIAASRGDDDETETTQPGGVSHAVDNPKRRYPMNDDLIYSVFKEIAIVEGKRNTDGTWNDSNATDVQRILARAFGMVQRAANPPPKEEKA